MFEIVSLKYKQMFYYSCRFMQTLILDRKKLHYIEMVDLVFNTRSTFQRITSGNVISILENDQRQDFYVQKVQYNSDAKEREQIGELAIALPIHLSETVSDQSLFCYLPLRSYGFKFGKSSC
jgi:hypothetical protein